MAYPSQFHKIVCRNKGRFEGSNFLVSTDSISWIYVASISITEHGQLFTSDNNNNHYLLLPSLQSCYIQICPNTGTPKSPTQTTFQAKRKGGKENGPIEHTDEDPPAIFIKTCENEKLYIRVASKSNFGNLISSLIVWQNLKPRGLAKKWYSQKKVVVDGGKPHELLVCRFKIYAPIPSKYKNLHIITGPKVPVYQPKVDKKDVPATPQVIESNNINEGWFYAMGALNSNGILNFISELDGTLLYSIDIKSIYTSEIREMHNSIFNSSNVLFIGPLKELRYNNAIRTTSTLSADQLMTSLLTREGKNIQSNQRIFIEFPLHIDLEDWFVGLNYFARREYIGSCTSESKPTTPDESNPNPCLADFSRAHFRVSKKISIDIIEAKFDGNYSGDAKGGKIYAEVRMWGYPWSRTAMVNHTSNPFWKEQFSTELPISTQMIHILIKKCTFQDTYSAGDKLIGTVFVTPNILTKQIKTSTTIMTGEPDNKSSSNNNNNNSNDGIHLSSIPISTSFSNNNGTSSLDIVRLTIYDPNNLPIGKLLLQVELKEFHILAAPHFKSLEFLLKNGPIDKLIQLFNENMAASEFERISVILLDIFQCLRQEDRFFKTLIEISLSSLEKKLSTKKSSSQNNVFNTLFRGSSIFSKALEKYNIRIGQEYLEKVFGDFFAKINKECKNCEVDPRYVRIQEKGNTQGRKTGNSGDIDDNDNDDDDDDDDGDDDVASDDDGYNSALEREKDEHIKQVVEENYKNLYGYAEEIWHKIYITSNDIPQQIKTQLKNFRTKVELVCEPGDKVTSLNCISAFVFLRFFCPAILNPKLFYLTKNHQTGRTQRTLTLIAKILLNLANRQEFSPHKEPHLVKMNVFLRKHQQEVYEYFDRITGRKNDFNEKILNLSHEVKRFDLGLDETSNELPTTPYLIDKYLRLTELVHLLNYSKFAAAQKDESSLTSPNSKHTSAKRDLDPIKLEELNLNNENIYQIGSLEFEQSEFLDLAGDNETEGFIKSLCNGNEEFFSFINSNITLKDIQKQSAKITNKIAELEASLENYEFPANYIGKDNRLWPAFANDILSKAWLDLSRNVVITSDLNLSSTSGNNNNSAATNGNIYKSLVADNAFACLKLRFFGDDYYSYKANSSASNLDINKNSLSTARESIQTATTITSTATAAKIDRYATSLVSSKEGRKMPFWKWLTKRSS
ncbi:BUD2 [Candida oxycetoniae]|uniref:BUD2 n=1 Tax=Candida oxycetoniae TaxID=497107 RepID=A0AAI9SXH2_9ASCO|nr:BUD2 [Candida oxycetoniae]KAI3404888.2 BUD2 [Candida oxycetoniae]